MPRAPAKTTLSPRRPDVVVAPRGPRYQAPPAPTVVRTHVEHDARSLLSINTDALEAVLAHGAANRRHQLEPIAGTDDDTAGFAARLELQLWLDTFLAEREEYRSVVVASELLLERSRHACQGLRTPHLLSTAVCMTILFQLAPQFRKSSELVTGIVDEVGQAIYVSPSRCADLQHAAQSFGRSTYFDAFHSLVQAFEGQRLKAKKYATMKERGARVLERAIASQVRGHALRMLRKWHQLTQHHKFLRQKYRKLFSQVSGNSVVESAIHAWRQHAHKVHVGFLTKHNRRGMEQLHEVQSQHRKMDEELRGAQFEATRRDRELEDARGNVDVLRTKLQSTRSTVAVAHSKYIAARKQWSTVAELLFNDTRRLPDDLDMITWMKNIWADQAVTPPDAVIKRMSQRSKLTAASILELMEAMADGTGRKRTVSRSYAPSVAMTAAVGTAAESAERILDLYTYITRGNRAPISAPDLIRGDQTQLKHFVTHLMEIAAGGYLGLFQLNTIPTPTVALFQSRLRDDPRSGEVSETHELGAIAEDWRDGQQLILRGALYEGMLTTREKAVAEVIQFGESVEFNRCAQDFFDQLNFVGRINREHLERAVIRTTGHAHDDDVVRLWPQSGVQSVTDLSNYFSEVAHTLKGDRFALIRTVQHDLSVASALAFLFDVHDDETQIVVKAFEDELRRAFVVHTDPEGRRGGTFDRDAAVKLVDHVLRNVTIGYPAHELVALYDPVVKLVPDKGPATMTTFLVAVTTFFDPNPYAPIHVRLRVFLRTLFRA